MVGKGFGNKPLKGLTMERKLPKTPNSSLTGMDMVKKGFGNESLKGLTMERKRVEEFKESLR